MLRVVALSVFLVAAALALSCLAESPSLRRKQALIPRNPDNNQYRFRPPISSSNAGDNNDDDLKLLDIVLVASVDGKFHALNRTSGHTLWSMSSSAFPGSAPSTLGPLVRTNHVETDSTDDTDDDPLNQELYIIEPQSGDIYVMATPSSPLQRLAFSMSQLVDMSPFSFSVDDDRRVFVGRKETSLFSIELETGKVKEVNSECPWDPFEDLTHQKDVKANEGESDDVDLDDLEGGSEPAEPVVPVSTEISIGRTDYHIAIHTRPTNPSQRKPPVQNLSFSTYGPNNRDNAIQAMYRRSADDAYVQSFPNGDIFAFRTPVDTNNTPPSSSSSSERASIDPLWINKFSMPVVAVFDVVQRHRTGQDANPDMDTDSDSYTTPFVLLQPRPRLEDSLGLGLANKNYLDSLPNSEKAYVGLVEESGSLFAMSPARFPLVAFGGDVNEEFEFDFDFERQRGLASSPSLSSSDVDAITARRKMRELCRNGGKDRRCLTGRRPLEESSRSWRSLLDGVPSVGLPPGSGVGGMDGMDGSLQMSGSEGGDNTSWIRTGEDGQGSLSTHQPATTAAMMAGNSPTVLVSILLVLVMGAMWVYRKVKSLTVHVDVEFRKRGLNLGRRAAIDVGETGALVRVPVIKDEVVHQGGGDVGLGGSETEKLELIPPAPPIPAPRPSSPASSSISDSYVFMEDPSPPNKLPSSNDIVVIDGGRAAVQAADDVGDVEDSEREGDVAITGKRKGPKKKRRGKKKKAGATTGVNGGLEEEEGEKEKAEEDHVLDEVKPELGVVTVLPANLVIPSTPKIEPAVSSSLIVSDTILGFGSHGTVVFKGSLQGRAVAVKRLLQDFVTLASREVSILQESDDHPNVIRYYYQEAHANFLYIALELCPASLADIIEAPDQFRDVSAAFEPKRALRQIASGLRHLHSLKLVHRDIKPQNILVSGAKKNGGRDGGHRMLISDFGLCKKLDVDQTSFLPTAHGAMAAGTVGWRAPEILRGEVQLDDSVGDESQSSRGSVGTPTGSGAFSGKPARLTKLVDIFALGCLFYYTLTSGGHPYGDRFEREVNILKNVKSLEGLERFGEEGSDAAQLISSMLNPEASNRPDTTSCLLHPFFWDHGRRLTFLQDASDRFEIMCRDPRDPHLITLEKGAFDIVGNDWHSRLDKIFIENLGKFRKYDGKSVQDLLRALRNKKNHYQDLPDNVKRHLGPMPEGFLSYFTRRYPRLFLHVHSVVATTSLRQESMFRCYFELAD